MRNRQRFEIEEWLFEINESFILPTIWMAGEKVFPIPRFQVNGKHEFFDFNQKNAKSRIRIKWGFLQEQINHVPTLTNSN